MSNQYGQPAGPYGQQPGYPYGQQPGYPYGQPPYPYGQPPQMPPAPGRLWYVVALLILVAGVVGTAVFIAVQIPKLGERLTQVVVPGDADLNLTETGTYTIFHERSSVVDGKVYSSENISGLLVTLRSAGGQPVNLIKPTANTSYSFGGRSGRGVLTFEIAQPGTYHLNARYDDGRAEPKAVLAVGHGFVSALLTLIFSALAIAFGAMALALILAITVFVRRRRARRAMMMMMAPPRPY